MEEVLAVTFLFGGGTAVMLAFSPVGKALAERIRGRGVVVQDPEVLEDLNQLRQEVAELHERLDYSERLLAGQPKSHEREA